MPMKRLSRTVVFVNTDQKADRHMMLKPKAQLAKLDDNDENVFAKSIVVRYSARPDSLEHLSLADFASQYNVKYQSDEADRSDSAPDVLNDCENIHQDAASQNRIILKDGMGTMYRRRHQAVIRFRRFNLLGDYDSYEEHFRVREMECRENESQYVSNMELIDQAIDENNRHGPPEHMWPDVAHDQKFYTQRNSRISDSL